MSAFPETSMTLLKKIAVQVTGEREAAWVHDPDDVVQDIFLKLVSVVRSGGYDSSRGSFRAFLATMIRRHLVSLYRKDQARGTGLHVDIEDVEPTVPADVAEQIDIKWRMARHQSAIEHVLTKTAISAQSRDIYHAYVEEGRSLGEVDQGGNLQNKVKSRANGRNNRGGICR